MILTARLTAPVTKRFEITAESAAETAREEGLDAYVDHRTSESAVQFQSGETGDDAREARRTFREIVSSERGRLGHPGNGCLEMPRFGH